MERNRSVSISIPGMRTKATLRAGVTDGIVEAVSMTVLLAVTQPAILLGSATLAGWLAPQWEGALTDIGLPAALTAFFTLIFS